MAIPEGGYAGKILSVDLSRGEVSQAPLTQEMARTYLGTRGFITRTLWDEVGPEVDALGPDNVLIFSTGPLCGTTVPSGAIFCIGAKSPLTGLTGWTTIGGHWAHKLKLAGYDFLIIKGKASQPVYLWIDDDQVEIREAAHIWGQDGRTTNKMVKDEIGDYEIDVAVIGPAGERLVKGANVMVTVGHSASYGMGAVMGSKNLKAVAVRGTQDIRIARPGPYTRAWQQFMDDIMNDPVAMGSGMRLGTTSLLRTANELGELGTRNFQSAVFEGADKISGERLAETYLLKTRGCSPCSICCDRFSVVNEGPFKGTWVSGPEYATLGSFGSKLGNDNLASILRANELCDHYGLDLYFVGDAIGFSMELYEKGIITRHDADGLDLSWGNYETMLALIEKIGRREGFGNLLAEGATEAAKEIGKGAEYYAIEIKGAAISSEDPRANNENALGAMLSTRGGDANNSWARTTNYSAETLKRFGIELPAELAAQQESQSARQGYGDLSHGLPTGVRGIGRLTKWWEDRGVVVDLMGVCKLLWAAYLSSGEKLETRIDMLAELYSAATGISMQAEDLIEGAQRVLTLEKAFNIREKDVSRKDDRVPERFMKEPMPAGPAKGKTFEDPDIYLDEYYETRGWDVPSGRPTAESYKKLGLGNVVSQLKKLGRLP
jgi:aldehyde:ferredoxin oxidoreductase